MTHAGDRGNPRRRTPRRRWVPHQRVLRQGLPGAARLRPRSLRRAGAQRPRGHRVVRGKLPPRSCWGRGNYTDDRTNLIKSLKLLWSLGQQIEVHFKLFFSNGNN
jgi:hypothetical protein